MRSKRDRSPSWRLSSDEDSHGDDALRDLGPELIDDQVQLLERIRLKLGLVLLGEKGNQSSYRKDDRTGEMGQLECQRRRSPQLGSIAHGLIDSPADEGCTATGMI